MRTDTHHPDQTPDLTERALRAQDPATGLDEAARVRSEALLERILATDPASAHADRATTATPRRVPRARWLLAPVAAGALAAGIVLVPQESDVAFAGWSTEPESLAPPQAAAAAATCATSAADRQLLGVRPLVADQRGAWVYVLFTADAGVSGECFMPFDGVDGQQLEDGSWTGSFDEGDGLPGPVGPRVVRIDGSSVGETSEGAISTVSGRVGAEVEEVVVTTPGGEQVTASVAGGRFAAWWPVRIDGPDDADVTDAEIVTGRLSDGTEVTGTVGR